MTNPLIDQVNQLIDENRHLRSKSAADDKTIHILKEQYAAVSGGIEDMVEDHRKIERELTIEAHNARVAYTEIEGRLNQVADIILQAARARVGDSMPPVLTDGRMPGVSLS